MSQRMSLEPSLNYTRIVERYAHFFDRPEVRLRFLNNTLAQHADSRERAAATIERFKIVKKIRNYERLYEHLLKIWLYHLIFQELGKLLPSTSKQRWHVLRFSSRAPLTARIFFRCYQYRRALIGVGACLLVGLLFGIYTGATWSVKRANAYLAERYASSKRITIAGGQNNPVLAQASAKHLPNYKPEKVWLVEEKDNYERYSNGARIQKDYETSNHTRAYYPYRNGRAIEPERTRREPVGIVYHTSESDLLPFTADNSKSIETHSRGLLEYVRRNKSYNYVIDRYGQIHRVVRDEDAAHHAGNSIWANEQETYVGLNESFLGVCFETTMEAGSTEEQLTEAQLVAGRLLTQVLRSRYQIDDANCVTHGLVSVNPGKMLICFHHDWARNFPFEAMGLSDKYAVAPASVSEFGFTYDEEVVGKLGGTLWAGVAAAEEMFQQRAGASRKSVDELRLQMRNLYREQMSEQLRLRFTTRGEADAASATSEGQNSDAPSPSTRAEQ